MKNIIKFLSQLGANADLSLDDKQQLINMMDGLNIAKAEQQAILSGNVKSLNNLLDICPDIVCYIDEPDGDDEEETEKPKIKFA